MKIIQITDIHLVPLGETMHGIDPASRLRSVIDHIILHQADAELVVVTGDLADKGSQAAYAILKSEISRLPMPVKLLLGNHDDREIFFTVFPETPTDQAGFVQSVLDLPSREGRLIFLDTNEAGWSGGRYCADRLRWLEAHLHEVADVPVTVFMHHPPGDIGVRHFEAINLHEPEPLVELLKAHKGGIRMIFIGHVHLPMSGVLENGLPFTAGRGMTHHMRLDLLAKDCLWMSGGPNYSVILHEPKRLISYSVDCIDHPLIGVGAYPPGP